VNVFREVMKKRWMSEGKNEKSCTARETYSSTNK
jgi:hypothetical protein